MKFTTRILYLLPLITFVSCKHEIIAPASAPDPGVVTSVTCSADTVYFQQQVLPIFISNCTMSGCHDAQSRQSGIVLTDYSSIMTTGKIRPFSPSSGEVYKKIITGNSGDRMPPPPMSALTTDQKDIIYKWIMQGAKNNSCEASCDTSVFTFAAGIKPIIANKCQGCHSGTAPQGGIDLATYNAIKLRVTDGKLWGSISHLPGYFAMPKGTTKLSDCELTKFKKWIASGAPNN